MNPAPRTYMLRAVGAFAVVLISAELLGTALTLLFFLVEVVTAVNSQSGTWTTFWPKLFGEFSALSLVGLTVTAAPAILYSVVVTVVFLCCRWTRRLGWALAFTTILALAAFALGWKAIIEPDRHLERALAGVMPAFLGASLLASAGATWVLHRFFRTVERNDS